MFLKCSTRLEQRSIVCEVQSSNVMQRAMQTDDPGRKRTKEDPEKSGQSSDLWALGGALVSCSC